MFCHIRVIVSLPTDVRDIRMTLACEKPLGVGPVQGILTQLFPSAITFENLEIHNDEES
jgi:hypothetical protein